MPDIHDRRKEWRFQISKGAQVAVINAPAGELLTTTLIDLSRSGLQLEVVKKVAAGTNIELRLQALSVFGQVISCRRHELRYRLGVVTGLIIARQLDRSSGDDHSEAATVNGIK
jgi:PilZ domain